MTRERFAAMGTVVSLLLPAAQAAAGAAVRSLFEKWEETLSRFSERSELSYLNRHAGRSVVVSRLLFHVLDTALEAARATDGLYDPTLLANIRGLGYDRSFERMAHAVPIIAVPPSPGGGWRRIQMDPLRRCVALPAGVGVDLGGIAKGMAVDAALLRLQEIGVESALVNAGGDLAVLGSPTGMDVWPISVPGRDEQWAIPLRRGALATSGIARRRWWQGGDERHHLIDPRTGTSAQNGLWSVSVVAASCAQAEAAAKAAFVLGPERGARFLWTRSLAGLLVETSGGWKAVGACPLDAMRD